MKNVLEMNIEELKLENEKLYKEYSEKCTELKIILREVETYFTQECEELSEETYNDFVKDNPNISRQEVKERLQSVVVDAYLTLSNLSCRTINLDSELEINYENKNKLLSIHFNIKESLDYIDEIHEIYKPFIEEKQ